MSASDVVSPGAYVMFRCQASQAPIRIGVTSITSGWQWAYVFSSNPNLVPPAYGSLSWNASGTAGDSSASGSIQLAYFFLSPTSAVPPGGAGTVNVDIKRPNGAVEYSSTLGGYRAVTTGDFVLNCTPTSATVSVPGTQTFSCTLSAVDIAPGATVTASIPAVSAPTGWTSTAPAPGGGTLTRAVPFAFSFVLTSSCAAPPSGMAAHVFSNLTFAGSSVTGPSTSVSVARVAGTTVSVAIASSSLSWTRPYAFTAYPTNPGSLTYTVQASGCAGWNVTVVASPFAYSGPAAGSSIPASSLTLTGSTVPSAPGITAPVTAGVLSAALKVLSASPTNGIGTFTQTLNLNLAIPAGALAGTYQSTVTITAAAGP